MFSATRPKEGICYIAYGERATLAAERLLKTITGRYPVMAAPEPNRAAYPGWDNRQHSRWAKVNLLRWSPYEHTLYLDADTLVYDPTTLRDGFALLRDGFDLALAASQQQGDNWLWHVDSEERKFTEGQLGARLLQLQCGVMFASRSDNAATLFEAWRNEWLLWRGEDQGAFLRALRNAPVSLALLGGPWNGGAIVGHHWGDSR